MNGVRLHHLQLECESRQHGKKMNGVLGTLHFAGFQTAQQACTICQHAKKKGLNDIPGMECFTPLDGVCPILAQSRRSVVDFLFPKKSLQMLLT